MGVILGVVDNTTVAKKQKNLLSWLHGVLTDLACVKSSCKVPCQAWETEYNYYIVKLKHWRGLQKMDLQSSNKNYFPVKRNSVF